MLGLNGLGVPPDAHAAIRCEKEMRLEAARKLKSLEKVIERAPENICAKTSIARLLGEGPVPKDLDRSLKLYEEAAQAGYDVAQFELALEYLGYGNARPDFVRGKFWLETAATRGHVAAQTELGVLLVEGRLLQRDLRRGISWLLKADEHGGAVANEMLEKMAAAISTKSGTMSNGGK